MITHLGIDDAIKRVYGKSLISVGNALSQWQMFSPYKSQQTSSTFLLKVLQVPSHLYTSDQIRRKKLSKLGKLLHKVRIIFLERCFQSSFYLLIAQNNLLPISSLLKIKRESSEKVDESIILDYLCFVKQVLLCDSFDSISFDENSIGVDDQGNFAIANYLLYFEEYGRNEGNAEKIKDENQNGRNYQKNAKRDIRNILAKLLMAEKQKIDLMELYCEVQCKYGQNMLKIVQKVMEPCFNSSQVESLITSLKQTFIDQSFTATITDTEQFQKMSEYCKDYTENTTGLDLSLNFKKTKISSPKNKKVSILILIFVFILLGIGTLTFKYLSPKPLQCEQDQFVDESGARCLNCSNTCQTCSGSGTETCLSCKGNMYLIMKSSVDKIGSCGAECHGIIIKTKTCVAKL